ncbi:MAG TPA: DUF3105 domain-containing protein [Phycisphaerae bacterium]|nr:DUF3105 domain-containing protein [Phycisphaerae bacterium]
MCAVALALFLASCDGFNPPPPGAFEILATPTGCGVKVSSTETVSWSVTFTASGVPANALVQWSFSDGTTGTGVSIVKTFKTAAQEAADVSGNTEDHDPINFDVTATVGTDVVTRTIEIPMRGTPDGGPEPGGDTCVFDEGRTHVANGTIICYSNNPPASGAHYSSAGVSPVAPGFYDEAVAPEVYVHNLEHGTVVLLYDCGGPCSDETKAQLQALFDALPPSPRFDEKKMVICRYDGISASCTGTTTFPASGPYLAISWDVQHAFQTLDTAAIIDFYNRHVDQGPEDAPIPQ